MNPRGQATGFVRRVRPVRKPFRCAAAACLVACLLSVPAAGQGPESRRFGDDVFRRGLKDRGLTDLLEFHLGAQESSNSVEGLLLQRELKLAQADDQTRSEEERVLALKAADEILLHLIRQWPHDWRVLEWRLEFIRSLVYRRAEPHYLRILYGLDRPEDHERVLQLTGRAIEEIGYLNQAIEKESARINELTAREYDRLEADGFIDRIEQMPPQSNYIRWWATFYRALARPSGNPLRTPELRKLLEELRQPNGALETPHDTSHVQAQSLLLAGMTCRLLADPVGALSYLNSALATLNGLPDPAERENLQWVATLAMVERVRALRDSGQFDEAIGGVESFRRHIEATASHDFRLRLLVALLERSVWQARALQETADGRPERSEQDRRRSTSALEELAEENSAYRDAVYDALFQDLRRDEDVLALSPLEQCALMAGLLRQAADLSPDSSSSAPAGPGVASERAERRTAVLDRAIRLADLLLGPDNNLPEPHRAEVLFNLAAAHYERGQYREAMARFLEVAKDYPRFGRAEMAALNAVRLGAELCRNLTLTSRSETRLVYLDALRTLTTRYAGSEQARYWQYFLAQTLETVGELDEAAREYERVDREHEHYLAGLAAAVRCRAQSLKNAAGRGESLVGAVWPIKAMVEASNRLNAAVQARQAEVADEEQRRVMQRLIAAALVDAGEVYVLPGVNQAMTALDLLDRFEERFPKENDLIGRMFRVRIIAHEALGQLEEAQRTIPQYVQADPVNAGPTMQALFETIRKEIERLEAAGQMEEAAARTRSALLLARQIQEWTDRADPPLPPETRYAVERQLAEAHLQAREWQTARRLFQHCLDVDADRYKDKRPREVRAILGLAEALYGLQEYEEALPLFNRVVRGTKTRDAAWWKALLRDLQCRTALKHEPDGIIRVIRQHRVLSADMGGDTLRTAFDALEKENQARQKEAKGPPAERSGAGADTP